MTRHICTECGHLMVFERCGFASMTTPEGTFYLCHADDHSCYVESPLRMTWGDEGSIFLL